MEISEIELHRKKKLDSLLCGKIKEDVSDFSSLCIQIGFSDEDLSRINSVLVFAKAQEYGEHPLLKYYVSHPIRVAIFTLQWLKRNRIIDKDPVIAALIHNVIEKDVMTSMAIQTLYGAWVSQVIQTITVDREAEKMDGWAPKYYNQLSNLDRKAQLIKAYDKFDNIYAICLNPNPDVRRSYLNEIETFIKPIIDEYAPYQSHYFSALIHSSREMGFIDMNDYIEAQQ